jgi:hypothetical protein
MPDPNSMLEAYFDDGSSHEDAAATVLAGYVGPASEWQLLATDWNALLKREKLPYYHSVDAAHGRKHFKGRTKEVRNALHREIVEMITRRDLVLVGAGVHLEGYRKRYAALTPENMEAEPKGPYFYCFYHALWYLSRYIRTKAAKGTVVFEESPKVKGLTNIVWRYLNAVGPEEMDIDLSSFSGPPSFLPKLGFPQLQAADVLAYEMGLSLRRYFAHEPRPPRASWVALSNHAEKITGQGPMLWCATPSGDMMQHRR